jgi:hypothetical protein
MKTLRERWGTRREGKSERGSEEGKVWGEWC